MGVDGPRGALLLRWSMCPEAQVDNGEADGVMLAAASRVLIMSDNMPTQGESDGYSVDQRLDHIIKAGLGEAEIERGDKKKMTKAQSGPAGMVRCTRSSLARSTCHVVNCQKPGHGSVTGASLRMDDQGRPRICLVSVSQQHAGSQPAS